MRHIHLLRTESTNTYLRELLSKSPDSEAFTVITAHDQTAGRGQKGNHWESNRGENITLSMLIRPDMRGASTFDLSIVAALAARTIIGKALEERAEVEVKWPNDILVSERKIAGILIENEFAGSDLECCIIGVGLNIGQEHFRPYQPTATSVVLERRVLGLIPTPMKLTEWLSCLTEAFVREVELRLRQMSDDVDSLRVEYHRHLYRMEQAGCSYRTVGGRTFRGTLLGVEPCGILRIKDDNTREVYRFAFKEVQFVFDH